MRTRISERGEYDLITDNRVQLLLGKYLNNELQTIQPLLDSKQGTRYPIIETLVEDQSEVVGFLNQLVETGLLNRDICGYLICCEDCGSSNVNYEETRTDGPTNEGNRVPRLTGKCRNCGTPLQLNAPSIKPIHKYSFSHEGIERYSDLILMKPLAEFLQGRGYETVSPGIILGESNIEHTFNILAFNEDRPDGVLAIDFAVSEGQVGEDQVISMFAKVYDANPQRSLLVVSPRLTGKARQLARQYELEVIETIDLKTLWKDLLKVIPPVEKFKLETLDVMTLLSLPDHLRKTAYVICEKGKVTAEEIATDTGRARAVESGYLNQLVRMGYLKKEREGRRVLFSVTS